MEKGLLGDILFYGSACVGVALLSVVMSGDRYKIDGNRVKDKTTMFYSVIEHKGKDKIKYVEDNDNNFKKVVVNGKKFTSKDTLIYQEALEIYNYLKEEINLRNESKKEMAQARKESKLQKKLDEEQKEIEEVLKVLRK